MTVRQRNHLKSLLMNLLEGHSWEGSKALSGAYMARNEIKRLGFRA